MKTWTPTPEQMETRVARFGELVSYQEQQEKLAGVPAGALGKLAARRSYAIMAPANYKGGRHSAAKVKGAPGIVVTVAEVPPGTCNALHDHSQAVENFFCISGQLEICWGSKGEHSITLNAMDFISVPPGVLRQFKNTTNEPAYVYAVNQIRTEEQGDRLAYPTSVAEDIAFEFGRGTIDLLSSIGVVFEDIEDGYPHQSI